MSLFLQDVSMKIVLFSSTLLCLYISRIMVHTYELLKFKTDYHIKSWRYPYTVSQMQSETVIGRNNLTFILCTLSCFFTVNQLCKYESYICLSHLTLAVLCIFPLGMHNAHEVIIFIEVDRKYTHNIHMFLVVSYVLFTPVVYFLSVVPDVNLFIVPTVGCIFIFSVLMESRYQLIIELILFGTTLGVFSNLEN